MRIEEREKTPFYLLLTIPILSILVAMLLSSALILWAGANVFEAYFLIFKTSLTSKFGITETLARSTPLIMTSLAAAIAFRCQLWNIGGEGQFYMGALAAVLFGTGLVVLPSWLMIPFLMIAGALFGSLTLLLPVYLKSYFKVDEVVTTLLLNFIIILLIGYLLESPIQDPAALGWPQSAGIIDSGVLPSLIAKSRLHFGFIIASLFAIVYWVLINKTTLGFAIRSLGANKSAALFAGINPHKTLLWTAILSGGIAGIAGVSEVAGLKGYLTLDISPGFGYTGIAVAMIALLHPLGVILASIFISALFVGADSMSRVLNVPSYLAEVIVGFCILCILVGLLFTRYKIHFKK